MELDDLKQALGRLDQRLEEQVAWQAFQARRQSRDRLEDNVQPVARGQTWLIAFGALTCLLGVSAWHGNLAHPGAFVSGIILHVYGVLTIATGVALKVQIARIDYAGSVLTIQRRLSRVRYLFVVAGMITGMPWCVLWVPFGIALFAALFGVDITSALGPAFLWSIALFGVIGVGVPWLIYRWAKRTGRSGVVQGFEDAFTGERLKRAQAQLDEIARFERD